MAVSVLPVSPQATTKETRQAQAREERESVTLVEGAPAPITPPRGGNEEEEEQEEEEGGDGDPGPPFTKLGVRKYFTEKHERIQSRFMQFRFQTRFLQVHRQKQILIRSVHEFYESPSIGPSVSL